MKSEMLLAEQTIWAVLLALNPKFSFLFLKFEWIWYSLFFIVRKRNSSDHIPILKTHFNAQI